MTQFFMNSPLGWLKLVEEENAITRIHFMDEEPIDKGMKASALLQQCSEELNAWFKGDLKVFSVLDHCSQTGTEFQQRVWKELLKIPYGKSISYRELSIRLGDEKCIRAAASANGQNNLPGDSRTMSSSYWIRWFAYRLCGGLMAQKMAA